MRKRSVWIGLRGFGGNQPCFDVAGGFQDNMHAWQMISGYLFGLHLCYSYHVCLQLVMHALAFLCQLLMQFVKGLHSCTCP